MLSSDTVLPGANCGWCRLFPLLRCTTRRCTDRHPIFALAWQVCGRLSSAREERHVPDVRRFYDVNIPIAGVCYAQHLDGPEGNWWWRFAGMMWRPRFRRGAGRNWAGRARSCGRISVAAQTPQGAQAVAAGGGGEAAHQSGGRAKLEKRADLRLSTLRGYVASVCGPIAGTAFW